MTAGSETCGNCGKAIGKLEKAHLWQGEVVCGACRSALEREATPPPVPAPPTVAYAGSATPPARATLKPGDIICPNPQCGYHGPPRRIARGSAALGCLLMFFFILPGVLYLIFMQGYRYVCPRCGMQVRSDN